MPENDLDAFMDEALSDDTPQPLRRIFRMIHTDLVKLTNAASSVSMSVDVLNRKVGMLEENARIMGRYDERLLFVERMLKDQRLEAKDWDKWKTRTVIGALIVAVVSLLFAAVKTGLRL